jgi:hypothetical protein
MRRREFITLLGGAAVWPLDARAQQGERMRRIGVLMGYAESDPEGQASFAAFRGGLQKLGWTEGRNILTDTRWGALDAEFRERTRRAAARPHSFGKHIHHCGAAATNAHHPHHFREHCRSGRQRLRRELSAAGRKRHRIRSVRADDRWQMAGAAQGDCAARRQGCSRVQTRQLRHMANIS